MKQDYLVYPSMIGAESGVILSYDQGSGRPATFDNSNPLKVSSDQCDNSTICIWYVSPLWKFNDPSALRYSLHGEFGKLTGVSQQRITSIVQDTKTDQITVTVQGLLNEHITLVFSYAVYALEYVTCWTSATNGQVSFIITPNNIACS